MAHVDVLEMEVLDVLVDEIELDVLEDLADELVIDEAEEVDTLALEEDDEATEDELEARLDVEELGHTLYAHNGLMALVAATEVRLK